jgi:hypothetical protein
MYLEKVAETLIFTAELFAILVAMERLDELGSPDCLLLTDTLSSLQALQEVNKNKTNMATRLIVGARL